MGKEDEYSDDMAWYSDLEKAVEKEAKDAKFEAENLDEDEEKKRLYQRESTDSEKVYRKNNDSY
jgi:hypothetical protein